ncbi:MAG: putative teichuronic acid biosynthesis glycosyltransferase TuaG [Firmicutes bacterium ADurb.Bin419]|nr:MAG: putative teichuronic acid biosynthesis glycosyltransferase TuaG [Firmicutes bacterium ADurb.Bin419]
MEKQHNLISEGNAAFVIPFWSDGKAHRKNYLNYALESIYKQTDKRWCIYIIDDNSPCREDKEYLQELHKNDSRIKVIFSDENLGPGAARNKGIKQAFQDGCVFICFLDSDDIAHKMRVEKAREVFCNDPDTAVVYSTFTIIDEDNQDVPFDNLIEGIKVILNDMENSPLEGYDVWIKVATERDNLTIPSSLNVRTNLAYLNPFPEYARFHEDTHTWLRYSASGAKIRYAPNIPSLYRVPQKLRGSESRERAGGIEEFNRLRGKTIIKGLDDAINLALNRGVIDMDKSLEIKTRFCLNVASLIKKEGTDKVAKELIQQAKQFSIKHFNLFKDKYDLKDILTDEL